MLNGKQIISVVKGAFNGTLDQQLSRQRKFIFGVIGILFAISVQLMLAWRIAPESPDESDKALLSLLITPFQLVAIYSLMNIIQSLTEYPYEQGSLWDIEKKEYTPFFLRVRGFSHNSFIVSILIANCLAIYMDYTTKHPNFIFWFMVNILTITVVYVGQIWLKGFMKSFENAIGIIKRMMVTEEKTREYGELINKNLFTYREGFFLLSIFLLLKIIEIVFSGGSWIGGGGESYVFPLTPLWAIFTIYTVYWGTEITICSIIYFYSRFSSVLKCLKCKEPKLFFI